MALLGNDIIDNDWNNVAGPAVSDDRLDGGAGSDTLTGVPVPTRSCSIGRAHSSTAGSAVFDHILDYDQGNSGTFSRPKATCSISRR